MGGFYFDGFHLGGISSSNGVPFFSEQGYNWIQSRAGSTPTLWKPCSTEPPLWQRERNRRPLTRLNSLNTTWELPNRSMVEAYYAIFISSALRCVFPIVDDSSFEGIVDRAYDSRQDPQSPDVIRAKACVLSFTAVLIHFQGKLDTTQVVDGEQCATRARALMTHVLEEVNSESLQICAMLVGRRCRIKDLNRTEPPCLTR